MAAVGFNLQAGIPTSPVSFTNLSQALSALVASFNLLINASRYLRAALHITNAANALEHAALLVSKGLPDCEAIVGCLERTTQRASFVQDLSQVGEEYAKFSSEAASLALVCDIDKNGKVDRNDINSIFSARNTSASPGDPRDSDSDQFITLSLRKF